MKAAKKDENERLLTDGDEDAAANWEYNINQRVALVKKRAWELSILPVKSLFMNVVMSYMMGSGGVFGFIILGYAVISAVRILFGVSKAFDDLQRSVSIPVNTFMQRSVYVACASAMLIYFLLQCSRIGLLPVTEVHVGTLPSIVDHHDIAINSVYTFDR